MRIHYTIKWTSLVSRITQCFAIPCERAAISVG